jgi:hypothetical protein
MKNYIVQKSIILFLPFFVCALCGCGTHINSFGTFNLSNKNFMLRQYVSPGLTRVNVNAGENYYENNLVAVILSNVGGTIAENSVREKINSAINPDSIAYSISKGIGEGLKTYFYANIVESLDENPQFITETRLEKFTIISNSSGIYAAVDSRVIITDRGTAKTVWENTESSDVPIGDVVYDFTCNRYIRTAKSVINAVRLMQMSGEEISAAVNIAAEESGKRQCDRLREDIAGY